jgi:hypothetical protein
MLDQKVETGLETYGTHHNYPGLYPTWVDSSLSLSL